MVEWAYVSEEEKQSVQSIGGGRVCVIVHCYVAENGKGEIGMLLVLDGMF